MDGSLVFVHGTGVRDISASIQRIRSGAQRWIGLPLEQVHGLEWGLAAGPKDLDVRPALIPDVDTRALNAEPTDSERGDLPLKRQLLASSTPPAAVAVVIGSDPPALKEGRITHVMAR